MKLKPPAETFDFLEVIYRARSIKIGAKIRRGEFDKIKKERDAQSKDVKHILLGVPFCLGLLETRDFSRERFIKKEEYIVRPFS